MKLTRDYKAVLKEEDFLVNAGYKKAKPYDVSDTVSLISKQVALGKRWNWNGKETGPKPIMKIKDREWSLLGLRIMDYWPTKPSPIGWAILWHKWNKGVTLWYTPPKLGGHIEQVIIESETTIDVDHVYVQDKPTFWMRRFPKGFSLTIAKLYGKWVVTRSMTPWMDAMLKNTPVLTQQELDALDDPPIIYPKEQGELF